MQQPQSDRPNNTWKNNNSSGRNSSNGGNSPRPPRHTGKPIVDNTALKAVVPDNFTGIFKIGKNGYGFVNHKDSGFVTLIEPQNNLHSLNGDTVMVTITDKKSGSGTVTSIVKRGKSLYTGVIEKKSGEYYLISSDSREPEFRIAPIPANIDTMLGKKVSVKMGTWTLDVPTASIDEILGNPGDNNTEMTAIVVEKGFDIEFPDDVLDEAKKLHGTGIPASEINNRRDMRGITTFTIDPIDAKDFDDALSYQKLPDGNLEIGIHIADVSYYVTPGSALDDEARKRTTSIYLVDRVIPMLPEVLSNELCSIRQDEDKLTYSCIVTLNPQNGTIISEWFGRTIIKSDKRFSYEEAQSVIDAKTGLYVDELTDLMRLSKIYTAERTRAGALSMDSDEVRFILDENGKPIRAMLKKRIDTMRMIEEWMLIANRSVAKRLSQKNAAGIAVYRIHDKPAPDRVDELKNFLKTLGFHVSIKNGIISPFELQQIIDSADSDDVRETLTGAIVRHMAKAIYSTENIGHFGLAFDFYTHFTSPIRRYPDVLVHRLMQLTLNHETVTPEQIPDYIGMCGYCSDREREAQVAERESIKYKQVEYMTERIGQTFTGIITGLGKFGAYVAEAESRSEGMIKLMDLGNDYFVYDEKNACIRGEKTKTEYRIGNRIQIRVKDANLQKKIIDYVLV